MAIDPYSKETETCQLCGNVLDQEVWAYCIVVRGKVLVVCTACQPKADPIPLPTIPQENWREWFDEPLPTGNPYLDETS